MDNNTISRLVTDALAIEEEEAKAAGTLAYMAKFLVQASLPYKKPGDHVPAWGRKNGKFSLIIQPGYTIKDGDTNELSSVGFPYGSIPRLLLAWVTTEAVKTKQKKIVLGSSLSEFMKNLGFSVTGGERGSIGRIKEQTKRLFSARISCAYDEQNGFGFDALQISDKTRLWWEPPQPDQVNFCSGVIDLNTTFFETIRDHRVPVDSRVLKAIKQSPLAIDIYNWLTYRMSYLDKPTKPIPWGLLELQFGTDYARTSQGKQGFKRNFEKQLKLVSGFYKTINTTFTDTGLILKPSLTHIPRISHDDIKSLF